MPEINLHIAIDAPKERVFDLARSIDLHQLSTSQTDERAISGRTNGLIQMGETVTWRARHFGIYQNLTSKIVQYDRPCSFTDEMVEGIFKSFEHQHYFSETEKGTLMIDRFYFQSPLGILGKLADKLFLTKYMRRLLIIRNQVIKEAAESNKWRDFLPPS